MYLNIFFFHTATIKKIGDQIVGEPPRKRGRPGRKPITEVMAEDEQSLYFIVRNGRTALAVCIVCPSCSVCCIWYLAKIVLVV